MTLVNPQADQAVSGVVNVVGIALDASGVDYVRLAVDSTNSADFIDTTVDGQIFSTTLNLTGYAEGEHTIYIYGADVKGNVSEILPTAIVIDREIPTVTLTSPANGAYFHIDFDVTGSAYDANSVNLVQMTLDNTNWDDISFTGTTTVDFSTGISASALSNGIVTVRVRAFDTTGKYGYDAKVITVDKIAPTIAVSSPTDSTTIGTSFRITGQASDNTGITNMLVKMDGHLLYSTILSTIDIPFVTNTSFEGPHNITFECYDNAGNKAEQNIAIVINENPARISGVSVSSLGSLVYLRGTVSVSGTAYDTGSVSNIYFRVGSSASWTMFATNVNLASTPFNFSFDTASYPNGASTIQIKPVDDLGGYVTFVTNVYIDNNPPYASFINPYGSMECKGGYLSVSASFTDNVALKQVTLYTNGAVLTNVANVLPLNTTSKAISAVWDLTPFADGSVQTVVAEAVDRANSIVFVTNHFIVSNNTPTIVMYSPVSGSYVPRYIDVSGIAYRIDGIKYSWVKIGTQSWITTLNTNTNDTTGQTNRFHHTIDANSLSEGEKYITVRSFASNDSYIDEIVLVTLDMTKPSASITAPVSGTNRYGTVAITGTASDNYALDYAELTVETNGQTVWGPVTLNVSSGTWSTNWDTSTLPVGHADIILEAADKAGNKTYKTNSITIRPYIVSISQSSTWINNSVTITGYNFGVGTVTVNMKSDTASVGAGSTTLTYTIPSGARSGYVGLTVNGIQSLNSNWMDLWTFKYTSISSGQANGAFALGSDDRYYFIESSRSGSSWASNSIVYYNGTSFVNKPFVKSTSTGGETMAFDASISQNAGVVAAMYCTKNMAGVYVVVMTNSGTSLVTVTNLQISTYKPNTADLAGIVVGDDKKIHVVFSDPNNNAIRYYVSADLGVTWTLDTPVSGMTYDTMNPEAYPSIALDSLGQPHIAYFDYGSGATVLHLRHVWKSAGTWYNEIADEYQYNGKYSGIFIDDANGVHVSYYNVDQGDMIYNYRTSTGSWTSPGVTADYNGQTGYYSSVAVNGSERAISFYNNTYYYATLAYFSGTGDWKSSSSWRIVKVPQYTPGSMNQSYGLYSHVGFDSTGEIYIGFLDGSGIMWVAHYLK